MDKKTEQISFAQEMAELEKITAWFESGEVDLDKGLTQFERGMEIIAKLKNYLGTVENRVEKIKQRFDQPQPVSSATEEEPPELE